MHFLIIPLGATEGNKGSIQINFICPGMSKIVLTQLIITVSSLLGHAVSCSSWDFGSLSPPHFCDFSHPMLLLYPLLQRICVYPWKNNTRNCIWRNTLDFFLHSWTNSFLKCLLNLRNAGAVCSPIYVCLTPVEDVSVLSCPVVKVFQGFRLSCLFHPLSTILVKHWPPACVIFLSLQPHVLYFSYRNYFFWWPLLYLKGLDTHCWVP